MASPIYFEFLNSVWEQLPEADRGRMAELWQGYEQIIAAAYQRYLEVDLNIAVADLQPWTTERWLPYTFGDSNFILRPAIYTSNQDLSVGINLTNKYLLKFKVDGGVPFEVDIRGYNPIITRLSEVITKINGKAAFAFASGVFEDSILQLASRTPGDQSSIEILPTSDPTKNACEYVLGVDPDDLPQVYPKFRYPYAIPYTSVASIPEMRDAIRDESVSLLLTEGVDYLVESSSVLNFLTPPPAQLWAERTQIDNENPWYNYGYLTEIFQTNSSRYVGVIQGLWFALWNGPTPANIRTSLYLLFGLPTAKENGVVTAISATQITVTGDSGAITTYPLPSGLVAVVAVGERVVTFQPLVDGIAVFDKVNTPGFVESQIGRVGIQKFLTENATRGSGDTDETKALRLLEEYTFLPQISVESFIYPDINLKNVTLFLDILKPVCKTYMFQVIVGAFADIIAVGDRIGMNIAIDLSSTLDSNETTYLDQATLDSYETTTTPHSDTFAGLGLDPQGITFEDKIEIEVRSFGTLIDSFIA